MSLMSGLTLGFFNLGGGEVLVILLVALLVLGPDKLPEASRQIGKTIATFRQMAEGFQKELESVRDEITEAEARVRGELSAADRPHPRPVQDTVKPPTAAPAAGETGETGDTGATGEAADTGDSAEGTETADTAEPSVPFSADVEPDRTDKPQSAPMANGGVPADPFAGTTPASVARRPPVVAPADTAATDDGVEDDRPAAPSPGSEL